MKKAVSYGIIALVLPATLLVGCTVFSTQKWAFLIVVTALLCCVPFFLSFERRAHNSMRLTLIAVLTALSVVGRLAFGALPGVKPVTALSVLTALYFGAEAGFMTGALTALVSNFAFGQGIWTPFQMFTWGLIGFVAGLAAQPLKRHRLLLLSYGALSGVAFSLLMDAFTVVWQDGRWNLTRYVALVVSAAPYTLVYAVSNVLFLLLLARPIGNKLQRVKDKYNV